MIIIAITIMTTIANEGPSKCSMSTCLILIISLENSGVKSINFIS